MNTKKIKKTQKPLVHAQAEILEPDEPVPTVQSVLDRVDQARHRLALLSTLRRQLDMFARQNCQSPESMLYLDGQQVPARREVVAEMASWLHAALRAERQVVNDLLARQVVDSGQGR
jgi:hypothetical protein